MAETNEQLVRLDAHSSAVVALEQLLMASAAGKPQTEFIDQTRHHFGPGTYVREFSMKAGDVVTGKIHRYPCLIALIQGKATITTEDGPRLFTAPAIWNSPAHIKRAVLCHEDCRFITVHSNPDDCQDVEELERRLLVDPSEAMTAEGKCVAGLLGN